MEKIWCPQLFKSIIFWWRLSDWRERDKKCNQSQDWENRFTGTIIDDWPV